MEGARGPCASSSSSSSSCHTQVMFRTLLSVCQDLMVNDFTDDMLVSWDKFMGAVYEEIATAYARTHLS